jgi:hypothetical protein
MESDEVKSTYLIISKDTHGPMARTVVHSVGIGPVTLCHDS